VSSGGGTPEAAAPTGEAGEECNPGGTCGDGLGCSATNVCVPGGDAGEPCTSAGCFAGLTCIGGNCTQTGDSGEPCNADGTCGDGLYCSSGTNTCTVSACAGKPETTLPYNISAAFDTVYTIGPELQNFQILNNTLDCDTTTWAPIPNTGTGDASVGIPDASVTADAGDAGEAGAPSLFAPPLGDGGVQVVNYTTPPPCYQFLFDPSCNTSGGNLCWAGAIFTNSSAIADAAVNGMPTTGAVGVCMGSGATMVTFWARASLNGALVKFGSTRSGQCTTPKPEADNPVTQQSNCKGDTEFFLQLSSEWTQYAVSLPSGEPYNDELNTGGGVWNAFSVVIEPEDVLGGTYVFVKDVTWTNAAPASFSPDGGPSVSSDAGDAASEASDAAEGDATEVDSSSEAGDAGADAADAGGE
jgi:hypothetical protein